MKKAAATRKKASFRRLGTCRLLTKIKHCAKKHKAEAAPEVPHKRVAPAVGCEDRLLLKMTAKCVASRAYHNQFTSSLKDGMSIDVAKQMARDTSRAARLAFVG
jgi:hypothetical protein